MIGSGIAREGPLTCRGRKSAGSAESKAHGHDALHSFTSWVYVYRWTTTAFCSFAPSTVSFGLDSSRLGNVVCSTNSRGSGRALNRVNTHHHHSDSRIDVIMQITDGMLEIHPRHHPTHQRKPRLHTHLVPSPRRSCTFVVGLLSSTSNLI